MSEKNGRLQKKKSFKVTDQNQGGGDGPIDTDKIKSRKRTPGLNYDLIKKFRDHSDRS